MLFFLALYVNDSDFGFYCSQENLISNGSLSFVWLLSCRHLWVVYGDTSTPGRTRNACIFLRSVHLCEILKKHVVSPSTDHKCFFLLRLVGDSADYCSSSLLCY